MFVLTEAQAGEIRTAYEQHGEFSAVVELRRLFPGLGDIAWARGVRPLYRWLATAADTALSQAAPG